MPGSFPQFGPFERPLSLRFPSGGAKEKKSDIRNLLGLFTFEGTQNLPSYQWFGGCEDPKDGGLSSSFGNDMADPDLSIHNHTQVIPTLAQFNINHMISTGGVISLTNGPVGSAVFLNITYMKKAFGLTSLVLKYYAGYDSAGPSGPAGKLRFRVWNGDWTADKPSGYGSFAVSTRGIMTGVPSAATRVDITKTMLSQGDSSPVDHINQFLPAHTLTYNLDKVAAFTT